MEAADQEDQEDQEAVVVQEILRVIQEAAEAVVLQALRAEAEAAVRLPISHSRPSNPIDVLYKQNISIKRSFTDTNGWHHIP